MNFKFSAAKNPEIAVNVKIGLCMAPAVRVRVENGSGTSGWLAQRLAPGWLAAASLPGSGGGAARTLALPGLAWLSDWLPPDELDLASAAGPS